MSELWACFVQNKTKKIYLPKAAHHDMFIFQTSKFSFYEGIWEE